MNKSKLIEALHAWINKRPGLDPRDYIRSWDDKAGRSAYFSEARSITKDLHHARQLLRYVELHSITAEQILHASKHSAGGRLEIQPLNDGEGFSIDYCVGQYWPTEYRRAVCLVLASAVWDYLRENMPPADGVTVVDIGGKPLEIESHRGMSPGDYLRKAARRELGRPIASRFFC